MPKPIDRVEQDIQDTLHRLGHLGIPERQIEREAGVPQGFLAKSRKGKNRNPNAAESWVKLRKLLVAKGAIKDPEPPPTPVAEVVKSIVRDGVVIPPEFAMDFSVVKSADELLVIDKKIATETALGNLEPKLSEALQGWSREIRQVLELQDEHQAREELLNLIPMTADQAEEFWKAQAAKAIRPLGPGEAAKPPESSA